MRYSFRVDKDSGLTRCYQHHISPKQKEPTKEIPNVYTKI